MSLVQHPVYKDFITLTRNTCPHLYEYDLYYDMLKNLGFDFDKAGNFEKIVGERSRVWFAAHLDTADGGVPKRVKRRTQKGGVIGTDGKTILGADDKAGVAVLLHLVRNKVPGRYTLFLGEEVGCVGSEALIKTQEARLGDYDQVVCFDRYGDSSIITHQMGQRCASDEYATALAAQFAKHGLPGLKPDDGGTFTDSATFIDDIAECTNISVGYEHQHTVYETQDMRFLVNVAEAAVKVNWAGLPTPRKFWEPEYQWTAWNRKGGGGNVHYVSLEREMPWDDEDDLPPYDSLHWDNSRYGVATLRMEEILGGLYRPSFNELRAFVENQPDEAAATIDALWHMACNRATP